MIGYLKLGRGEVEMIFMIAFACLYRHIEYTSQAYVLDLRNRAVDVEWDSFFLLTFIRSILLF
jgi:hypothetical protein